MILLEKIKQGDIRIILAFLDVIPLILIRGPI